MFRVILLLSIAVFAFDARGGQGRSADRPELRSDSLAWVQQFVWAFYPELEARQSLTISAQQSLQSRWHSGGLFQVVAGTNHWETAAHPQTPPPVTTLTLGVRMDKWGRIHEAWGGLVGFERARQAFKKLLEQRADWTEAQAIQALADAGAAYGPDARDALLKKISLASLEPFIGACKVDDLRFRLREDNGGPSGLPKYRADVEWALTLRDCARPGEPPLTYVLLFEPFGGTLVHLLTR